MIVQLPLDDHLVCLDIHSQRLSVANFVGARILNLHSEGYSQSDICGALNAEFDTTPEQVKRDVHDFLQRWESGDVTQFKPAQNHQPDTDYVKHRPLQGEATVIVHLPGGSVQIVSETSAVVDALQTLFHLTESVVGTNGKHRLEIFDDDGRYPIVHNGRTLDIGVSIDDAAIACLRALNIVMGLEESHAFTLHAAAVAKDDSGVILAARGGSGKSTLAAYLIAHGYLLINDDAIQLTDHPVKLVPIPVPMSVKAGSWHVLDQWYPTLMRQRSYGFESSEQRYLPPTDAQVCRTPVECKVVCFPRYRSGAVTCITSIDRPAALTMLIESGCYLPTPVQPADVEQLVRWTQNLTFHELKYSDLREAASAIDSLLCEVTGMN